MHRVKQALIGVAAVAITAAALFVSAETSQAAAGYQYACSPWRLSGYDFRQYVGGWGYHAGQDIGCPAGAPVYAAADGVVKYSALTPDSWRWGNLIMIEHDSGATAVGIYGHLGNDRRISAGSRVSKGQRIGSIGPSRSRANGRWGAHLHFQMRPGGYGSATGTYWSIIHGYESKTKIGQYTHPTRYIQNRKTVTPTYRYQVVSQPGATSQSRLAEYWVSFRLKNTGTATWRKDGEHPVRLGTDRPRSHRTAFSNGMGGEGWIAGNRIALPADVSPGETVTVRAKFNNKGIKSGTYRKYFRPVVEGERWIGGPDMSARITVRPPRYSAKGYRVTAHDSLSSVSLTRTQNNRYLVPGGKVNLKAYIKNTGDIAWSARGKSQVRLGTDQGRSRKSKFYLKSSGSEGWISPSRASGLDGVYIPSQSRIALSKTVDPGEIGVFSFTVKAPSKAGSYREHFRPLIEGKGWLNDIGMYFGLRVLPSGNHYEWVKQESPDPIALGRDTETASVYIRNSGQASWNVGGALMLGTDNSRNRASAFEGSDWISANRASRVDAVDDAPGENSVNPGQVARFDFKMKTTTKPDGSYKEYFRPVIDGKGWLPEDYKKYVPVTVRSAAYDYAVVEQKYSQDPDDLGYGDSLTATVRVKNYGTEPWPVAGINPVRLATSHPQNRESVFAVLNSTDPWISPSRASAIDGRVIGTAVSKKNLTAIKQGEVAEFNVPIRIDPAIDPDAYLERFNLVHENKSWLPYQGIFFPLTITSQTYDYKVVNKSYSRNLAALQPGQTALVKVAIKNTGRYAWPVEGSNRVQLGATRPNDRQSSLATLTGTDPWSTRNRASGIDGRVTNATTFASVADTEIQPGETALFSFTITPTVQGQFSEYFKLVQENRGWFPDHGLSIAGFLAGTPGINGSAFAEPEDSPTGTTTTGHGTPDTDQPLDESQGLVRELLNGLGLDD